MTQMSTVDNYVETVDFFLELQTKQKTRVSSPECSKSCKNIIDSAVLMLTFIETGRRMKKYICNFITVFSLEVYCGKMKRVYIYKI